MTNTDYEREPRTSERTVAPAAARNYDTSYDNGRRRDLRTTTKETRRSFQTTEFWLTLLAGAAVVIAGYWDEAHLAVNLGWALGIGLAAMYVLSRGIAKAGSTTRRDVV